MLWQSGFLVLLIAVAASAKLLWEDVCTQSDTKGLPFCDMSLTRRARVSDFVKRVDLQSKSKMMVNSALPFAPLHIPAYQWWSEGLHGPLQPCVCIADNKCKCPTSFPCPSALAAAFNNTLYHLIGSADGREGRAINNLKNKSNAIGDGVSFWSPTVNMQRDPRWGRNQEVRQQVEYSVTVEGPQMCEKKLLITSIICNRYLERTLC
jgi:beta-glucosidase